jgi:hypothetical protein
MPRAAFAALLLALGLALPPPSAAAVSWAWPVRGRVLRTFAYFRADPFRRGQRRGVELAASPGARVRVACGGRVVVARPGWVVTVRCGPWRVTHLPLAAVAVHVGDHVRAGARVGTLGTRPGFPGLHLGVRRAGDRLGYVDPLVFLPPDRPPRPLPPTPIGRRPRVAPRVVAPPRLRGVRPIASPAGRVRVPGAGELAPWPAWVGLGLALCGALGGGVRWRVRTRRARAPVRAGEGVA